MFPDRRGPRRGAVAVVLAFACWTAVAVAETPQERRRRELMEGIGLRPQAPSAKPAPSPVPPVPEDAPAPVTAGAAKAAPKTEPRPSTPSFRRAIHPALMQSCRVCHVQGGPAGVTRMVLSGEPTADHRVVVAFVDARSPSTSPLLVKAAGQAHGGGAPWPPDSAVAARVTAWIAAGARLDAGAPAPVPAEPSRPPPAVPPRGGRIPPASGATAVTATGEPAAPPPSPTAPPEPQAVAPDATAPDTQSTASVHPLLVEKCASCHRPGLPGAATRLVISGDLHADLPVAAALVDRGDVARSPLLTKAAGELHGGGVVLPVGSDGYQRLFGWATGLAAPPTVTPAPASTDASGAAPAPPPLPASPPPPPASGAPPAHAGRGLLLPYGFQLNGRFDLNYERRGFSTDPTAAGATNALRSYHHFLFLSRQSPEERIGLSVELLGLLFWEVNLRFHPRESWQLVMAAGKIVVPFGADPLMHQSYGGLAGFDQRLLPTLWATEGAAAHFVAHRGALAVTDDLFVIRGFALRRADAILSLRSDVSPDDDSRLAVGNRAGAAWGPVSLWYSFMFNPLGYGRRLVMQAADVTVWRARDVPVLRYLSLGAGVMRADVSGGGAGADYYHFGSYFQVRVHPSDWLYLQYRQGVTTIDNRRGTVVDRSRLTSDDASAHNLGVVARRGGASAGLFWFVNLEAVEIANDVVRAVVTYEF